MSSYCMKCKTHTDNVNEHTTVSANGRAMIKSTCPECGSKKSKFIKQQGGAIATTLGTIYSGYKAFNEYTAPYQQKAQNRIDARMAKWDAEDAQRGSGTQSGVDLQAILNKLTQKEQKALALALGICCLPEETLGGGAWDDFLTWTRGGRKPTQKSDSEVWNDFRNNFTYGFNAENLPNTTEYLGRLATR